jgi:hypothetical protein
MLSNVQRVAVLAPLLCLITLLACSSSPPAPSPDPASASTGVEPSSPVKEKNDLCVSCVIFCGDTGQPCCGEPNAPNACAAGNDCEQSGSSYVCTTCGGDWELTCTQGAACNPWMNNIDGVLCLSCGAVGQDACTSGPACQAWGNNVGGTCTACGGVNEPPCTSNEACEPGTLETDTNCSSCQEIVTTVTTATQISDTQAGTGMALGYTDYQVVINYGVNVTVGSVDVFLTDKTTGYTWQALGLPGPTGTWTFGGLLVGDKYVAQAVPYGWDGNQCAAANQTFTFQKTCIDEPVPSPNGSVFCLADNNGCGSCANLTVCDDGTWSYDFHVYGSGPSEEAFAMITTIQVPGQTLNFPATGNVEGALTLGNDQGNRTANATITGSTNWLEAQWLAVLQNGYTYDFKMDVNVGAAFADIFSGVVYAAIPIVCAVGDIEVGFSTGGLTAACVLAFGGGGETNINNNNNNTPGSIPQGQ